jgi:hypothetical protein
VRGNLSACPSVIVQEIIGFVPPKADDPDNQIEHFQPAKFGTDNAAGFSNGSGGWKNSRRTAFGFFTAVRLADKAFGSVHGMSGRWRGANFDWRPRHSGGEWLSDGAKP